MKLHLYLLALGFVVVTSCFGGLDNRPFSGKADIQGQFASSVNADLAWVALDEDLQHSVHVDDDGRFALQAVPVGEQVVLAADGLGGAQRLSITVLNNRPNPVQVQVQPGAWIEGQVEIHGQGNNHRDEIKIGILGLDALDTELDDAGHYRFWGLAKACYSLWIDSDDCPGQQRQVCTEAGQGQVQNFVLNNCQAQDAGDDADDASEVRDAGFTDHSSSRDREIDQDAGIPEDDAALPLDAGHDDAGHDDASPITDAAIADTQVQQDANEENDAGVPDAAGLDAGNFDAGDLDANSFDTNSQSDAQSQADHRPDSDASASGSDDFCQNCHSSSDCNGGFCSSALVEENGGRICTKHCEGDDECPDGFTCQESNMDGQICLPRGLNCEEFKHLGQSCGISNPCGFLWNPELCQQGQCSMSCDPDSPCPQGFECQQENAEESGFCQ